MKLYALATNRTVIHGHGSCGTDLVIPIYDSYSKTWIRHPVFLEYNKAEEYKFSLPLRGATYKIITLECTV